MRTGKLAAYRLLGPVIVLALLGPLALSAMAAPSIRITAPENGATIQGTDVTVQVDTVDVMLVPSTVPLDQAGKQPGANRPGEGHLHFMLDLGPVVVWDRDVPYTFTNVPPGEHQLMVELVNNDHSPLSPPVVEQIQFRSVADQILPRTGVGTSAAGEGDAPIGMIIVATAGLALMVSGLMLRRRCG